MKIRVIFMVAVLALCGLLLQARIGRATKADQEGENGALPAPKPNGALRGRFPFQGEPLVKAKVEVCVELMGNMDSGATPCTKQLFVATTTTDETGAFLFEDLPAGFYVVTVQAPDGSWKQLTSGLGIVSKKTCVDPAGIVTLETMDIGG